MRRDEKARATCNDVSVSENSSRVGLTIRGRIREISVSLEDVYPYSRLQVDAE